MLCGRVRGLRYCDVWESERTPILCGMREDSIIVLCERGLQYCAMCLRTVVLCGVREYSGTVLGVRGLR